MIIGVYPFVILTGSAVWFGNLTHPYPFRYVYYYQEPDQTV